MKVDIGQLSGFYTSIEPSDNERLEDVKRHLGDDKRPVVLQTVDSEPLEHPAVVLFNGGSVEDEPDYTFDLSDFCRVLHQFLTEPKIEFLVIRLTRKTPRDFYNAMTTLLTSTPSVQLILHDSDNMLTKLDYEREDYDYLQTEQLLMLMDSYNTNVDVDENRVDEQPTTDVADVDDEVNIEPETNDAT